MKNRTSWCVEGSEAVLKVIMYKMNGTIVEIITKKAEAHPATGSPNNNLRSTIKINTKTETNVIPIPVHDTISSGAFEKLINPSMAYRNNFQKLHFDSPATLSTFSYGSQ